MNTERSLQYDTGHVSDLKNMNTKRSLQCDTGHVTMTLRA